jgi:membrane-associated phospholipid phosphatase
MFHYAVDVVAGLLLGVLAVLAFNRDDKKRFCKDTLDGMCER